MERLFANVFLLALIEIKKLMMPATCRRGKMMDACRWCQQTSVTTLLDRFDGLNVAALADAQHAGHCH
ncbi:Semaphorin-4F [Trichinella spiralis]|uniref:Semaphorin-4F n=1 Tax=Trichinella spiralis TaxID=6334 RepID=A0ABR3K666_TRISP